MPKKAYNQVALAESIEALRLERKVAIEELARLAGVNPKTVQRALDPTCESETGAEALSKILTGLGAHPLDDRFSKIFAHAGLDLTYFSIRHDRRFGGNRDEAVEATVNYVLFHAGVLCLVIKDLMGIPNLTIEALALNSAIDELGSAARRLGKKHKDTRAPRRAVTARRPRTRHLVTT